MKIDITGSRETPVSESPDASRQNAAQVLITEAEVAFRTAAAAGVRRKERRWLGRVSRVAGMTKGSRGARRPIQTRAAYLEPARMAREMERL